VQWRCPRTGKIVPAGLTQQVQPKCQFAIHCFFNSSAVPKLQARSESSADRPSLLNLAVESARPPLKDYPMESLSRVTSPSASHGALVVINSPATQLPAEAANSARVLRNTYALLSLTLLFSAAVAAASVSLRLPSPGLLLTLGGYFGLLYAVNKLKNSGWALPVVFALTGFMGFTLGPMLSRTLAMAGGGQVVLMALAATGATFLSLSAWVLTSKRDFSFMGGFLFAGMVIALLAGLGAVFLQIPALGLAVSAMVALLSAGLILFETSRIVNGGESNYVLATVSLYLSIFNLFTSLLSLFGFGGFGKDE
jgi:modulator of FtsH protease